MSLDRRLLRSIAVAAAADRRHNDSTLLVRVETTRVAENCVVWSVAGAIASLCEDQLRRALYEIGIPHLLVIDLAKLFCFDEIGLVLLMEKIRQQQRIGCSGSGLRKPQARRHTSNRWLQHACRHPSQCGGSSSIARDQMNDSSFVYRMALRNAPRLIDNGAPGAAIAAPRSEDHLTPTDVPSGWRTPGISASSPAIKDTLPGADRGHFAAHFGAEFGVTDRGARPVDGRGALLVGDPLVDHPDKGYVATGSGPRSRTTARWVAICCSASESPTQTFQAQGREPDVQLVALVPLRSVDPGVGVLSDRGFPADAVPLVGGCDPRVPDGRAEGAPCRVEEEVTARRALPGEDSVRTAGVFGG